MQFDEVLPAHFSTISRNPFPHTLIERTLLQIAEGKTDPAHFRTDVLAAAGWKHSSLVSFGKYPDEAAATFNRIRLALADSEDPHSVLAKLKGG